MKDTHSFLFDRYGEAIPKYKEQILDDILDNFEYCRMHTILFESANDKCPLCIIGENIE